MLLKQAFWDYNFSEKELLAKLQRGTRKEKAWAIGRMLENLPFDTLWKYITLPQLRELFSSVHLRPKIKKIWQYTLNLWSKYEKEKSTH